MSKCDFKNFIDFIPKVTRGYSLALREGDAIRTLKSLGFGRAKVANRIVIFKRLDGKLSVSLITECIHSFINYIKEGDCSQLPNGITVSDILNLFYKDDPINEHKDIFQQYLLDSLSAEEEHELRLLIDPKYRRLRTKP